MAPACTRVEGVAAGGGSVALRAGGQGVPERGGPPRVSQAETWTPALCPPHASPLQPLGPQLWQGRLARGPQGGPGVESKTGCDPDAAARVTFTRPQAPRPRKQAQPGAAPRSAHPCSCPALSPGGAASSRKPFQTPDRQSFPDGRAREAPTRPLPPASLPEGGSQGPQDQLARAWVNTGEAGGVLTCRDPGDSHGPGNTGAHLGRGISGQHLNQLSDSRSQIQSDLVKVG